MGETDLWTIQEIAFKAEEDRYEDPDSKQEAFILCAEDPATRTRNIVELRNMIYSKKCIEMVLKSEASVTHIGWTMAFLLRFLRARRPVPARAHRLIHPPRLPAKEVNETPRTPRGFPSNIFPSLPTLYTPVIFEIRLTKAYMAFIEIAFQAEISRYEDSEFEEYAKRHCNEDPDTRGKEIEELRRLIRERGECNPRRTDDAYLLRFLRCRRSIPALAHRLSLKFIYLCLSEIELTDISVVKDGKKKMVRYEEFHRQNAYLYDCDPFELVQVKNVYAGILPESPDNGRVILMRFGRWDVDVVPIEDVVRLALVMDEIAVMQPKLQILGVTIIVDLDGLNLRQVAQMTPTVAGQIVSLMGVSFPLPNHSLHIIRYNWLLHSIFYLFKQFMPKAVWNRIHFHGNDVSSLHKHIDPEYLPPELGGRCRHVISTEEWLSKINEYKDDYLVQELRDLGFKVDVN